MHTFETIHLPSEPTTIAPDGSAVRILAQLAGGSMAHFALTPGKTAKAVCHCTIEEIWFVLSGSGEMWRELDGNAAIVPMSPGVSLTIPVGTWFQFRSFGPEPLAAIAVTMPPWPGEGEAIIVAGPWEPTV